jgi:hypothetical protein
MTILFFLGAGWLACEYPLPALVVAAATLVLKHWLASGKRRFPGW